MKPMDAKECIKGLESLKDHCASMVDEDDQDSIWMEDVAALQYAIDFIDGKGKELVDILNMIQENPELPIVAMVDGEIVADHRWNRWLGSWGSCYVEEYFMGDEGYAYFRNDNSMMEIIEVLEESVGYDATVEMTDEEAKAAYAKLPWIKAIIVNIDLPD